MLLNNNFNILPWYDSLEKQSSKKWYTFGQSWPLLCPKGQILPFQFICEELEILSNIFAVNVNTGASVDLGVRPTIQVGSQADATYYVVKMKATSIPDLAVGTYYLRFNTNLGFLYSEEITVIDDVEKYIKIQYWNESTLNFASGEINFADDFKFELYINSTIGKPEYEFEEELTKRLGYKFIESQTSNKVYKFAFIAPEYICDAMRLIRLCDYIKITTKFDSYNALSFAYEPKWQDQGDLAAIDVEFDTDCIIQKLESFNRRLKESFYNALLADIDEPVLFSTDTVAQYYTEFTSISLINGKLIRQLDAIGFTELKENKSNLYIPIDNVEDASQKAKKVSAADLLSLLEDINKLFKGHYDENGSLVWIEALSNLGVRGGVTMFVDGGQYDIPTIAAGLPFDNQTIWLNPETGVIEVIGGTGSGSIGSIHWNNIEGKPSFATVATSGKYADLSEKPDLTKYALQTDIPSLSGYATEKWVTDKNYLDSTKLSEELAKYVTIDRDETIYGVKNFTNGLMIGGLPLTKMEDDVVYLDAHLVVRGGITMFGTGEDVDVPTIMDALSVDGVNLKVINGVLTFVGEATGGVADSVRWENVIGRPTLLSSFTDDVVAGKYLPLSGGIISGTEALPITISNNINDGEFQVGIRLLNPNKTNTNGNTNGTAQFGYSKSNGVYMFNYDNYNYYNCAIGITDDGIAYVGKGGSIGTKYKIWHEGNDGSGSGLDADLLDGLDSGAFFQSKGRFWSTYINSVLGNGAFWTAEYTPVTGAYTYGTVLNFRADGRCTQFYITDGQQAKGTGGRIFFRDSWNAQETMSARWLEIITNENIGNQTVSKANQLTTARTIWGQSFDGTGNVDGNLTMANTISPTKIKSFVSENEAYTTIGGEKMPLIINNSTGRIALWKGDNGRQLAFNRQGSIEFSATTTGDWASSFGIKTNGGQSLGNVCGAYGNAGVMAYTYYGGSYDAPNMVIMPNGDVGIGTASPSFKLDVKGGVGAQSYGGYNGNTNISSSYRWAIYQWNNELQITRRDSSNTYKGSMAAFDLASGNVLFEAGITMYSDQRKKTILNHVELSLKQIADAPLIEHYYNSDESKTTHVGSIAQYWAEMNDWFCKKDNEGFYTMEIQNAALASAISIARELVKYESKTDKKIRLLKKRIGELEEEIEKIKTA